MSAIHEIEPRLEISKSTRLKVFEIVGYVLIYNQRTQKCAVSKTMRNEIRAAILESRK